MAAIGALHAEMTLQLHTKHAVRMWYGRKSDETQHGILGLSRFLLITDQINTWSRQGDPYSDWFILRIEGKIAETKVLLEELNQKVDQFYKNIPTMFHFTENFSSHPITLPIYAKSPLSYLAIYMLAQYDEVVRKILQALHLALISRTYTIELVGLGEQYLRNLFSLAQHYRYTGITRKDLEQGTATAKAVIEKYGEVPTDILNGTLRSRFSIPLTDHSTFTDAALQPDPESELDEMAASGDES